MSEFFQMPIYQDFVSPELCRALQVAGLEVERLCFWNIYDKAFLKSYAFDREDYYRENDKAVELLNPPKMRIPAFQTGDLNALLPNYCLSRDDAGFILSIENNYQLATVTDKRMPDVFARMVLACLRARIIIPQKAIETLSVK